MDKNKLKITLTREVMDRYIGLLHQGKECPGDFIVARYSDGVTTKDIYIRLCPSRTELLFLRRPCDDKVRGIATRLTYRGLGLGLEVKGVIESVNWFFCTDGYGWVSSDFLS